MRAASPPKMGDYRESVRATQAAFPFRCDLYSASPWPHTTSLNGKMARGDATSPAVFRTPLRTILGTGKQHEFTRRIGRKNRPRHRRQQGHRLGHRPTPGTMGARVAICARDAQRLEKAAATCEAEKIGVLARSRRRVARRRGRALGFASRATRSGHSILLSTMPALASSVPVTRHRSRTGTLY